MWLHRRWMLGFASYLLRDFPSRNFGEGEGKAKEIKTYDIES